METRQITDTYAVSPQIAPEDVAQLKADGFTTLICNRPNGEVPPSHQSDQFRALAEAEGLTFVDNPVIHGQLTLEIVEIQGRALAESSGPVFAYCASGNRSSIVWALSQAGRIPTDDLIAAAARWGYDLEAWRGQIDALAARED